jgi:hypothetical protein
VGGRVGGGGMAGDKLLRNSDTALTISSLHRMDNTSIVITINYRLQNTLDNSNFLIGIIFTLVLGPEHLSVSNHYIQINIVNYQYDSSMIMFLQK